MKKGDDVTVVSQIHNVMTRGCSEAKLQRAFLVRPSTGGRVLIP